MSTILIVDSAAVVREPIAAALRSLGYATLCAADGEEALDVMSFQSPDLVLLDMLMPHLDGLGVLKTMRTIPQLALIPVIVLTGATSKEYVLRAKQLGVQAYLLKSQFSLSNLFHRVAQCLNPGLDVSGATTETAMPTVVNTCGGQTADSARTATGPKVPGNGPEAYDPQAPGVDHAPGAKSGAQMLEASKAAAGISRPIEASHWVDSPPIPAATRVLKDLTPILSRAEVAECLEKCSGLKAMSPAVMQVLQLCRSTETSVEKVADAIKNDHAIALKILKLANSVVYTRGDPVDSVKQAVVRIGLNQLQQAVQNIAVVDRFSGEILGGRISTPLFWEHSIATGLIAAEIAHSTGLSGGEADRAFTMGLLHDVGRMVYAEVLGEKYEQVLNAAEQLELPLEQVESRMLMVNHAEAMEPVLQAWNFPTELIKPIVYHHLSLGNIRRMSPQSLAMPAIIGLADRLSQALLLGTSGNASLYPIHEFTQVLRLDEETIRRIEETIPSQTADIKFAMLSRSKQPVWQQYHLLLREQFTRPVRPLFVSSDAHLDVFRMACNRVWTPEEAPPEVAVVFMAHERERSELTSRLLAAESSAGVASLPTLVLSPNGNLHLAESDQTIRYARLGAIPMLTTRFFASLQQLVHDG